MLNVKGERYMNLKREHYIYIGVALAIVIGVVGYLTLGGSSACSQCGTPVSGSDLQQLYAAANNNTLANNVGQGLAGIGQSNLPKTINGTPLTVGGKPEIFYVGGDYCPFCAISRWGLVVALMRFGNFTNLKYMRSSPTDVYANSATFSFRNSSYSSRLVHFDAFELFDRLGQNASVTGFTQNYQNIAAVYGKGSIPFMDFANSSVQVGATVTPQILTGNDWNQIIPLLQNPNSTVSQAIIGNADVYTAYICRSSASLRANASACRQNYVKSLVG